MALPREYPSQDCPIARSLEVIGERWTLLIVRDAFYGVSRFSDFRDHLAIPRAVLTDRLALLAEHGILERAAASSGRDEYALTAKGRELWPVIRSLVAWGNEHYLPDGRRRQFTHAGCGGAVDPAGRCEACAAVPPPAELLLMPRPGASPADQNADAVSRALRAPRRLLAPIGAPAQPGPPPVADS
jgi:DNA-binding HxlR family transcriptional regulator